MLGDRPLPNSPQQQSIRRGLLKHYMAEKVKVGIIGLCQMGSPVAGRLLCEGVPVVACVQQLRQRAINQG
jgi:phosphoglycerate dehydrogenase-like enzyme